MPDMADLTVREFAVMGMQRSGTTVFSHMLNSHPDIFVAKEIFHPVTAGVDSFFEYERSLLIEDESIFWRANRLENYNKYINMLREYSKNDIIGVNVKYSSCHHLDDGWKRLSENPGLFDEYLRRETRIIHVIRENFLLCALSNIFATESKVWHREHGQEEVNCSIEVDIQNISKMIENHRNEMRKFNEITENYPYKYEVFYEKMFDGEKFSENLSNDIAQFLSVSQSFDLNPKLDKSMPIDLSKVFVNFDEIKTVFSEEFSI